MSDTMPDAGSIAPSFSAPDQGGKTVSLDALKGKWVVLYFYPKDDTPGCTKEACNFRDNHGALRGKGAVVVGVSGDSEASHTKFAAKYDLPFSLLVDGDHEIARRYGAWGLKKMYGREYEGITRATFIIDPDGKIAQSWPKVKPDQHGTEVLDWLTQNASN